VPQHIAILLFDDVEELDAVGPWEVLADTWSWRRRRSTCCCTRAGSGPGR
jgi:hypothetical protein